MIISHYTLPCELSAPVKIAQVADLHNGRYEKLLGAIEGEECDLVLVTGDFLDRRESTARGFAFLEASARKWPTFVSLGNHEMKSGLSRRELASQIEKTGATLLDNACVRVGDLLIGGLSSGYAPAGKQGRWRRTPPPDVSFLDRFSAERGAKVLMCHHPEYYDEYLASRHTGYIFSGHAHGGQWRFFGRGIFSPGQGLFPRYTAGLYHGRLLVSRGLCQTNRFIPRIFNPRELVIATLAPRTLPK